MVEHRSAVMNITNEVAIGQNANHQNMARFSSIHDRNFRPVLSRLNYFRNNIANQLELSVSNDSGTQLVAPEGEYIKELDLYLAHYHKSLQMTSLQRTSYYLKHTTQSVRRFVDGKTF